MCNVDGRPHAHMGCRVLEPKNYNYNDPRHQGQVGLGTGDITIILTRLPSDSVASGPARALQIIKVCSAAHCWATPVAVLRARERPGAAQLVARIQFEQLAAHPQGPRGHQ